MRRSALAGVALLVACTTPLSNRIDVGNEAFLVVVGEGAGGIVDLFAAPAEGGEFRQLTFTRGAEDLPRLDPTGTRLAFLRVGLRDQAGEPVVLELKDGREHRGTLPAEAGAITAFGWPPAGDTVVARTESGLWWAALTGALQWTSVPASRHDDVTGWTAEQVGDAGFGMIARCGTGTGWCIVTPAGETPLPAEAADPIRWGADAVAYRVGDRLEIRPLGGGRIRQPGWTATPAALRRPTHHPGSGAR